MAPYPRESAYFTGRVRRGWLHPAIYARVAPPAAASEAVRSAWREGTYGIILGLSRSEYEALVTASYPDADPRRLPLPSYCTPDWYGPARLPRRRLPTGSTPQAIEATISPRATFVAGALLYLASCGGGDSDLQPGLLIEVSASVRQIARVLGVSHSYVLRIIHEDGGHAVVPLRIARPSDGKGLRGITRDGRRTGAPAHPTNTYLVYVHERALLLARQYHAAYGPPPETAPISPSSADSPHEASDPAALQWHEVREELRRRGMPLTRIQRLYGELVPVAWDGQILTLRGPVVPLAAQLLECRCRSCRIRILPPHRPDAGAG